MPLGNNSRNNIDKPPAYRHRLPVCNHLVGISSCKLVKKDNERFISTDDFSSLERFENDETLETQELQRLIHEAIFSLPPKCRDVFNKSRMDNLSNKEIAEQMNISVKAVEGHISRALKQIRAYLGDAYHYLW